MLGQQEVRLALLVVGGLFFLVVAYLFLSFSMSLGSLLILLMVLAVLVLRRNRGSQTVPEQRLFEAVGWYGRSARKAYEVANAQYREWSEKQAAERERDEALRRVARERSERRVRFQQYRRFFERAHEGSRNALDWWQAYDTGEFDDGRSSVSDLLRTAQQRAEGGVGRLRGMEGTLSQVLGREEFEKADLLLDGAVVGQENFEGKESVFAPLVAVHERIKGAEGWNNYREQFERFIRDLEDLLGSPSVRTAAANRTRFPEPDRPHGPGTAAARFPDPHRSTEPPRTSPVGTDVPLGYRLVSTYPHQECIDQAEAFMVGKGYSVRRGGSTVTFARDRRLNWLLFFVLLLFGVLPAVIYAALMAAAPVRTTLVTTPMDGGTGLTVQSDDGEDAAVLEGWIRSNLLAGGSR